MRLTTTHVDSPGALNASSPRPSPPFREERETEAAVSKTVSSCSRGVVGAISQLTENASEGISSPSTDSESARDLIKTHPYDNLMKALSFSLLAALALALSATTASAQNYSIDWYKIAGGGGTSSNGQFSVSGTIGQHDAGGPMTGGNFSLTGGFWSLLSVVQSVGSA